jgi:hypothetical protein
VRQRRRRKAQYLLNANGHLVLIRATRVNNRDVVIILLVFVPGSKSAAVKENDNAACPCSGGNVREGAAGSSRRQITVHVKLDSIRRILARRPRVSEKQGGGRHGSVVAVHGDAFQKKGRSCKGLRKENARCCFESCTSAYGGGCT